MRRSLPLSLLGVVVLFSGGATTYVRCPGCIPRDRVNTACEWRGDSPFTVHTGNPAHWSHLVEDAQLAEELGIRYADAEHGRRFGVDHHGGLLDNGRVRNTCLDQVFGAIERHHGTTASQILAARASRNSAFDLAVALLFVPLYLIAVALACRRLYRRFPSTEGYARGVGAALACLAISFLGVQGFRLWGGVWEVIRVGNGHMTSIRAASETHWVKQHPGADFLVGVLLFWLVAVALTRMPLPDALSSDGRVPGRLLKD